MLIFKLCTTCTKTEPQEKTEKALKVQQEKTDMTYQNKYSKKEKMFSLYPTKISFKRQLRMFNLTIHDNVKMHQNMGEYMNKMEYERILDWIYFEITSCLNHLFRKFLL